MSGTQTSKETDEIRSSPSRSIDLWTVADSRAVAYLNGVLGPRLTAEIARVSNADRVDQWARGQAAPPSDSRPNLRVAFRIIKLLEPYEDPETVQAWFVGMNFILGDRAPALVIADDPDAVMRAAYAFVAYG